MEHHARPLERLEGLLVGVLHEAIQGALGVLGGVEREDRSLAAVVPVQELGVLDLDVGGVQEHGAAEVRGRGRGVDGTPESLFAEKRDRSRMIDVGVR